VLPDHLLEIVARFARLVRDSAQVDQRSGVSARFAVAAAETVAASAVRRAAVTGEPVAVARVCDLPSVVPASRGKVEFEAAEEGRELEVLAHLLRKATADAFRARLAGVDLSGLQARFDEGATVETGDLVPAAELLGRLGTVPGLAQILARLGVEEESPGLAASALEFALEGLHLNRRLSKDAVPGRTVYGGS
jgi:magnesium chelatase subunit I